LIECPDTDNPVLTGFVLSEAALANSTFEDNVIDNCPHCGGRHVWQKEYAFRKGIGELE
jgi:hypothetical protein